MKLTCDNIKEKYSLENLQERINEGELLESLEKEIIEIQLDLQTNLTKENIELRFENSGYREDRLLNERKNMDEEISIILFLENLFPLRSKLLVKKSESNTLKDFDVNLLSKLKKVKRDKYQLRPSIFPLYDTQEIEKELMLRIKKSYGFNSIPKDIIEKLERSESLSLFEFIKVLQFLKCEQELEPILRSPLEPPLNRELTTEQKQKIRDASPEDIIKIMHMLF